MSKLLDKNEHGVSQLIGTKNNWALDLWREGCNNNWHPDSISLATDKKQWEESGFISDEEKLLVKRVLGLFSCGESLVSNSIETAEYKYITCGACRQYMMRKAFEESLHNWTVALCCETFQLKQEEVAEAYINIKSIKNIEKFLSKSFAGFDKNFDIDNINDKQRFMKNMFIIYDFLEGSAFFSAFALIMGLSKNGKLPGLGDNIFYTIRDETVHQRFGETFMIQSITEYPEIWTDKFKLELIELMKEGLELAKDFALEVLPKGMVGISSSMLIQYVEFLANARLSALGLGTPFTSMKNPFPWLSQSQDVAGMTAFFERREKSYQQSSALDDDF